MKKEAVPPTEEQKLETARKVSIKEGACSSAMDGFGLRYITPYALALGATNAQIALLSSLPSLIGNVSQLGTLKLIQKFPRKKIVLWGVAIQALMWIPLILIGWLYFFNGLSTLKASLLVIALYTAIVIAGASVSPAWSSWMKDILASKNGGYFSNRNKIITGVVLISMLVGGSVLDYFQDTNVFLGFAVIFSLAFLGRAIAVYYFTKQYEPEHKYNAKSAFTLVNFIEHLTQNNFGRFAIFVSIVSLATSVAGPFFAVYMLKELNLDYLSYTLIILSPVVSTFVFLPVWGKFSDIHGNVKILKITGYLIPFIPLLWMFSAVLIPLGRAELVFYLFVLEIFSGFAWAGFNQGSAMFIFDAVSKDKMPYCIAYFNILTGIGIFIGAMFGGYIASFRAYPFGLTATFATFLVSGLLRLIAVALFLPWIKEVKPVAPFSVKQSIKSRFKEDKAMLTTQFWRLVGFKPLRPHQPTTH